MNIDLRNLRWAMVAAQHRSLRQAAEVLNARQSTLSRGLRHLEHQFGAVLFDRTNGGTRPTEAGLEFLQSARRIVEEAEAIRARLSTRSQRQSGQLTVGVHTSLSAGNFRATLIEHWHRFPEVELHMVDGSSDHLISELAGLAIDVAFVTEENPRWTDKSLPVWSERVVVAIPENHALADRDIVHWAELTNETLLMPERGPGPQFLKLLMGKTGCSEPSRIVRHDMGLDRFLTLVGVGRGILLALEGATGATYPGVTFREVHDSDGPSRLTFRAYWRHANSNPSLHRFLDMLRERYPDLSAAPGGA
ncbi:MAG: LysR family transcriptional regulator [Mesorhizobium sp.]|uniref:LysR family transcriptional regulator n=1 Tax=Mesorhizobium sp. TaxID=1871066 RepID=UPI000FE824BE|nr:LysR family transcriptional regulator [Mesorhizobium sp.]RWO24823.1 MAG: LysR family transcriptional regulator [Mesorhizobium sp.]